MIEERQAAVNSVGITKVYPTNKNNSKMHSRNVNLESALKRTEYEYNLVLKFLSNVIFEIWKALLIKYRRKISKCHNKNLIMVASLKR